MPFSPNVLIKSQYCHDGSLLINDKSFDFPEIEMIDFHYVFNHLMQYDSDTCQNIAMHNKQIAE